MGVRRMGPPQRVTIILSLFLLSGTAWACKSTKTEVGNIGSGPRGQMTSPNFTTGNYPNSFHESNTIKVDKGHLVKIRFTDFDLAGWIDLKLTSQILRCSHSTVQSAAAPGSTLLRPQSPTTLQTNSFEAQQDQGNK